MQIGGFQKISLIDYPGKISSIIFTQGCNLRCPYCHNKELVIPSLFRKTIDEDEIISFLFKRKEVLQGVVITGGEPTLQKDLIEFLEKIKKIGFFVKLDTNGTKPQVIKNVIQKGLVDYIAMDVKASLKKYSNVCAADVDLNDILESINIILESNLEYCFRTTVVPTLIDADDLAEICYLVKGHKNYVLQSFIPRKDILDESLLSVFSKQKENDLMPIQKSNYLASPNSVRR